MYILYHLRFLSCLSHFNEHAFFYVTGIGQGRVTENLQGAPVDRAILVKDADVVAMVLHSSLDYVIVL